MLSSVENLTLKMQFFSLTFGLNLLVFLLSNQFSVKADDLDDAKNEFDSYIENLRNRMNARSENISTIIGDYVSDFEFGFYNLFVTLIQPEINIVNHDNEVIDKDVFYGYIQEKAEDLIDQYSNQILLNIISPENQYAQQQYLDPIVSYENKLVVVASFRDNALQCLQKFHTSFYIIMDHYWNETGIEIDNTLADFQESSKLILQKVESDIKLYRAKGKLFCRDLQCLGDFVSFEIKKA